MFINYCDGVKKRTYHLEKPMYKNYNTVQKKAYVIDALCRKDECHGVGHQTVDVF